MTIGGLVRERDIARAACDEATADAADAEHEARYLRAALRDLYNAETHGNRHDVDDALEAARKLLEGT